MFKSKTLFIVGAGASAEADLPVGAKLAKNIAQLLTIERGNPGNEGEGLLAQLYARYPLANSAYHRAARAISEGVVLSNSIDDFLDRHSNDEMIQRVGKAAIVKTILTAESESLLFRTMRDKTTLHELERTWYLKFFRMLGARVNASNVRQIFDKVAFIVFNYDRCLEYFLINALQLVYSIGQNEAAAAVSDCHIIHPYGVIANLPYNNSSGIPFGGAENFEFDCVTPSQGVKIFTEQIVAGELLQQLHAELNRAEQIVFLGFGFLDENMTLLRPATKINLKNVFATAFEMSESSIDAVKNKLAGFFSGNIHGILPAMLVSDQTCAALFDHYAIRLPG
jgi:hypothetical protein